jgi:flagellar hook-basal body protein
VPNPDASGGFVMMRPNGAQLQGSASTGAALTAGDGGRVVFRDANYPTTNFAPTSIEIGVDGVITVIPPTGETITTTNGFLGLKSYVNPDGLKKEAAQMYTETTDAASVATNPLEPGVSGTGFLRQSSLEQSNVDLTTEFTKMIVAQRNFQANAKTITTADEMLQAAINVKR